MKKEQTLFGFLILLACSFGTVNAQIKGISEGDLIRVTSPSSSKYRIEGKLVSISQTHIRLDSYSNDILISSIIAIDKRRRISKTISGALIGGAVGSVAFGLISMAMNEPCDPDPGVWFDCALSIDQGGAFIIGSVVGVALGATVGTVVGALKHDQMWRQIPLEITAIPLTQFNSSERYSPGIRLKWTF